MGPGADQRGGSDAQVAALGLSGPRHELQRGHVVDPVDLPDDLEDLGAVDVAAEEERVLPRLPAAAGESADLLAGWIVAVQTAQKFFGVESNRRVLDELGRLGVELTERTATVEGPKPLAGKTLVLTGTLAALTREAAREAVEALGGRVTASVTRKTDYVVVGDAPGSKADDARRLGVETLDEAAFLRLVGQA